MFGGSELLESFTCAGSLGRRKVMLFLVTIFLCRLPRGEDYIELAQIPGRFTYLFLDADVQLVYFTTF